VSDTEPEERLEHALGLAFQHLNRRDRTEAEIRSHLQAKGVAEAVVESAVETLHEQGYVDDARFARLLTHDKRELEGWGNERIRRTLVARGIGRELIDDALRAEAPSGELDRALELLRRRFPAPPDDPRERERALGVLLRKGYESELALDALSQHAREAQTESFG
jgi:regulatory protein